MTDEEFDAWFMDVIQKLADEDAKILVALS
jgi:hypothetical protein